MAILVLLAAAGPASGYNVYYANLHSHSALSDGIGTPQEAFTYARDLAQIDVLALTDHTHLLSASEFSSLLAVADQLTEDGVFVALGAQEFGNLNDFGHINIYDAPYRNPNPTENLSATYNWMRDVGAFGCFNHPNPEYGTNFNNLAFVPEYADQMTAIEVRNGLAILGYETQYIQALDNGWKIGPFAGQDNHEGHWGDQGNPSMGGRIYLTGILADALTQADILEALRARRFFAMEVDPPSDRIELDFRVEGHPMGSVVITGVSPHFALTARAVNGVSLFNRVELFRDGGILDRQVLIGTQIGYEYTDYLAAGESHYYFARVTQVDSDQAWSSPVWVTTELAPSTAEPLKGTPGFGLLPAVPNPAAGPVAVRFVLPERGTTRGIGSNAGDIAQPSRRVRLSIYDPSGRRVRDMGERCLPPGPQEWIWDGSDDRGTALPVGPYFSRLSWDGSPALSGRLVLVR